MADVRPEAGTDITFPVIEEFVTVHKTVADDGGVRLRKVVHEHIATIDEDLARQSVDVKRVRVDREVDGPVAVRYENGVTIIPVVEERLVLRRQWVLVEEVHVAGVSSIDRDPQSIVLRREEIIVERQQPGSDTWQAEEPPSPRG